VIVGLITRHIEKILSLPFQLFQTRCCRLFIPCNYHPMAEQSSYCARADDSFGPSIVGCRDDFDFTLLFEETILSILPLALALLFAPPRIFYLLQRERKVERSPL
jgi:hypothetical protein